MKIVKQDVQIIDYSPKILDIIEQAGRICYKSESKGEPIPFIEGIISRGHEAVIEHGNVTCKFITNRAITHELVRHRIAAYCQECVSGDTKINKKTTIKQLFDRLSCNTGRANLSSMRLKSLGENNVIIRNKIKDVFYKGKAELYRLKTKLGYSIDATKNHRFVDESGNFKEMSLFSIGDKILVNGKKSLISVTNEELIDYYNNKLMSPQEIADTLGVSYRPILERIKKIGIFVKRKNDKNKEKYNKNHTRESIEKGIRTIKKQYENGRIPWNKGIKEHEHPSVFKQGESLRKNHHNGGENEKNPRWKNGCSQEYCYKVMEKEIKCEICGSEREEIHHIDKNRKNNKRENLLSVCINCHKKIHHGWEVGIKAHLDEIVSIEYIGVDDVYDIEMNAPYHSFVANGFIVHNSSRYCSYDKDKFGNEITVIEPYNFNDIQREIWYNNTIKSEETYFALLKEGVQAQIARDVLPHCLKTEIYVTTNLREWRHILRLRLDKKAHPQMRELMSILYHKFMNEEKLNIFFKEFEGKQI